LGGEHEQGGEGVKREEEGGVQGIVRQWLEQGGEGVEVGGKD